MYATIEDIAAVYGQDMVDIVSARGDAGESDSGALDAALETASSEIDSYLAARYGTPLDPVPPYIRQICVDIAVYRLAHEEAPRTLEMRLRYEDAIKYLTVVSKGLANIDTASGGGGDSGDGGTTPDVGSKARVLTIMRC